MKDNRWHDATIDTNLLLQLQDLTTILSQTKDFQFDYTYGSFVDITKNRIAARTLWDTTKLDIQRSGYKTDVYLRAIGTLHHSELPAFHNFWNSVKGVGLTQFATQLITLFEDLRLEEIIKRRRPGTTSDFAVRRSYLKHFFTTQLTTMATRNLASDELFCMIYLLLESDGPEQDFPHPNQQQLKTLEKIKLDLYDSFTAKTTQDSVNVVTRIVWKLADAYEDMSNMYFAFPIFQWEETYKRNTLFDELTRTDDVANEDHEEVDQDNNEYTDETFSTWHHENENEDRKQNFLQMDLDVGTKTNLEGGGARDTESSDQAFATAQGMSGKSDQKDYSKRETLDKQRDKKAGTQSDAPYGEDNIHAIAITKDATP